MHSWLSVECDHLRDLPVKPLGQMHTRLLHAVQGMPVPIEMDRVLWDPLCQRLEVSTKLFRKLPLDTAGIPPVIRGNNKLLRLGGHTAVVEDQVDVVLGPPGVGVDREPLEGLGQEVLHRPFGGALLCLLWGGVEVDEVLPSCLGATLLFGGLVGFLALLGLHHCRWWPVLVASLISRVVIVAFVVRVQRAGGVA